MLTTSLPDPVLQWWAITPPGHSPPRDAVTETCPIDLPTPVPTPPAEGTISGQLDVPQDEMYGLPLDRVLAWLVATLVTAALLLWLLTLGAPVDAAGLLTLAMALTTASVPMWMEATL